MKDYKPMYPRESGYKSALDNWDKRSRRLIVAWYACDSTINKKRIENLIFVLRGRVIHLTKMLNEIQGNYKVYEWEEYSYTRNTPIFCAN